MTSTLAETLRFVENLILVGIVLTCVKFWKEFFSIGKCSSGHDDPCSGWILRMYRECGSWKQRGKLIYRGTILPLL